jgi:hypothetical protein
MAEMGYSVPQQKSPGLLPGALRARCAMELGEWGRTEQGVETYAKKDGTGP